MLQRSLGNQRHVICDKNSVLCLKSAKMHFLAAVVTGVVILYANLELGAAAGPLTFPDAYYAAGNIYLPYGDIAEPFEAWVNMKTGKSRQDTYNGTARIINRGDLEEYGIMYKIVPMTTNNVTNQITCFKIEGVSEAPVMPQGVLPNASLYVYATDIQYQGVEVSVYISSFAEGNKMNNYTILVRKDNGNPVLLHFIGYDRLFGSHYDEYVVEYTTFSSATPDPSVFDFQEKYQCIGFPGPGVTDPMSENPFFEFVGAPTYSHKDKQKRAEAEFKHFSHKHDKQYEDEQEIAKRKSVFNKNYRYIMSINRQNRNYKLAVNHMADYSEKELRMMRGVFKTPDSPRGKLYQSHLSTNDALPVSWNWRLRGAVTPVKDQGICGSCWSFGTTGTLEGSYFIKHGQLISLSEQSLVDCSWGYGNDGCDGGESERAYQWIMHSGCIPTESSYGQYLMQDGFCHADKAMCGARITQWYNTPEGNVSALVEAIYMHGPISVAIDASHLSFAFYSHGVYYEPKCGNTPDDLDHQVLAVGFGNQDEKDYILVKNSWSTHWGMDGYILMSQRDNNCGIATDASFASVE